MSIEFEESVEAEAIGSDNDKPAGSGHALAIIVPTAIVRPAVASAMLVLKLIATPATTPACGFSTSDFRHPQPEHSRRLRRRRPRRSRR
jgi:hypothetical protein